MERELVISTGISYMIPSEIGVCRLKHFAWRSLFTESKVCANFGGKSAIAFFSFE
jgi:hypothetical protein